LITERMMREGESQVSRYPLDISQIFDVYSITFSYHQWSPDQLGLTWLTESKGNRLSATDIEYVEDLPEYPQTSEGGYAYVIPIGERTAEQVHTFILITVCVKLDTL
jgi:hypothetical protein